MKSNKENKRRKKAILGKKSATHLNNKGGKKDITPQKQEKDKS